MGRDRADDPDVGIVDDKTIEAKERIDRIEREARGPSVEGSTDEQQAAQQISEREELDQAARP